jgi:hypothetical protein
MRHRSIPCPICNNTGCEACGDSGRQLVLGKLEPFEVERTFTILDAVLLLGAFVIAMFALHMLGAF